MAAKKNPAGSATLHRRAGIGKPSQGSDHITAAALFEAPASWPVRWLSRRHGLPLPTARTLAALAGLGGAA